MNTRAIILAAGRGSRMKNLTDSQPKCRSTIHNKELIQWQLDALKQANIKEIAIVRGYLAKTFDLPVNYFDNPEYRSTNMLQSLIKAESWLKSTPCIISYSDIVYHYSAVTSLLAQPYDIAITYDPNWLDLWSKRFENPLEDAETFQQRNGILTEIGSKTNCLEQIQGQYMGLFKTTPKGWNQILSCLTEIPKKQIDLLDMTALFKLLLRKNISIFCVPYCYKWYEIDSQSDLKMVNNLTSLFKDE